MPAPIPVLLNPGGGAARARGAGLADAVRAAFAAAGAEVLVELVPGPELPAAVRARGGGGLVVAGGGDGTLGCAAGALIAAGGTDALGILPLGTRNHLAADLGLPADLAGAAHAIVHGTTRRIDIGEVNGHLFVNNASVGLYATLVDARERWQARGHLPKALANLPAAVLTLAQLRHHRLRLLLPGGAQEVRTPVLFVGNNRYAWQPPALGHRARLDEGVLSLAAVAAGGRWHLLALAARLLAGRATADRDFAALAPVPRFTVEAHRPHLRVALDGEVRRLAAPLAFRSRPGALAVRVPAA